MMSPYCYSYLDTEDIYWTTTVAGKIDDGGEWTK